jgi:hypothetical protein
LGITTTFDIYGHLMPQARKEASAKLERNLFDDRPTEKTNVRTLLEQKQEEALSETVN